jgi:hypothetical protein
MADDFFFSWCRFGRLPFDLWMEVNKMRVQNSALELTQTGEKIMSTEQVVSSKAMLWTGRVISSLLALILTMDAAVKVLKLPAAVEATARLGYSVTILVPLGLVLLACVALYLLPRTRVVGAILLTGYLGGATATQVRMQDPWFALPVVLGILIWLGLYLRDGRLRTLVSLRSEGGIRG